MSKAEVKLIRKNTTKSSKPSDLEGDTPKDDDLWPLLLSRFSRQTQQSQTYFEGPARTPLEQHLENFTRNWISICNNRDWTNPLLTLSVAPNMKFSFSCPQTGQLINTLGAQQARMTIASMIERPEVQFDPISIVAEIHPPNVAANGKRMRRNANEPNYATVWVVSQISGIPTGILREANSVFYYRREKDGRWLMAGYKSFTNRPPLWDGLDGPYDAGHDGYD